MSVNLVLLKSGEELITDVKEIKSGNEIVGYFFDDPLRLNFSCLLYTSPSPRDKRQSRMPSSA